MCVVCVCVCLCVCVFVVLLKWFSAPHRRMGGLLVHRLHGNRIDRSRSFIFLFLVVVRLWTLYFFFCICFLFFVSRAVTLEKCFNNRKL